MLDINKILEMSNKEKKKYFLDEIKKLQTAYLKDFDRGVSNKTWKEEWKNFIKYDHDWDWEYFVELILYKLEKMRLSLVLFTSATEDWSERINQELTEAITLGKKPGEFDYEKEADDFYNLHATRYVKILDSKTQELLTKIYRDKNSDEIFSLPTKAAQWRKEHNCKPGTVLEAYGVDWDCEEGGKQYLKMVEEADKKRQEDYDKFFLYISQHMRGWWD